MGETIPALKDRSNTHRANTHHATPNQNGASRGEYEIRSLQSECRPRGRAAISSDIRNEFPAPSRTWPVCSSFPNRGLPRLEACLLGLRALQSRARATIGNSLLGIKAHWPQDEAQKGRFRPGCNQKKSPMERNFHSGSGVPWATRRGSPHPRQTGGEYVESAIEAK